jgi:hypothetical protein
VSSLLRCDALGPPHPPSAEAPPFKGSSRFSFLSVLFFIAKKNLFFSSTFFLAQKESCKEKERPSFSKEFLGVAKNRAQNSASLRSWISELLDAYSA